MISVTCPACGNRGHAPDDMAGRTMRCRQCGEKSRIRAPAAISANPFEVPPEQPNRLAFDGSPRVSVGDALRWISYAVLLIAVVVIGVVIATSPEAGAYAVVGVVGLLALAIYLLPTLIANGRDHPNVAAIALLNALLGWTFLGWVAALVWSATGSDQVSRCPTCQTPIASPMVRTCPGCGTRFVRDE